MTHALPPAPAGGSRGNHYGEQQKRGEVFQPRSVVRKFPHRQHLVVRSPVNSTSPHDCLLPAEANAHQAHLSIKGVRILRPSAAASHDDLVTTQLSYFTDATTLVSRGSAPLEAAADEYVSRIKNYTAFEEARG